MAFSSVATPRNHEYQKTLVKQGATLGANSTIVCGHTIGRFAFICAGAVVTHDVPDFALVVGDPGRSVGWMCQCGVKLASKSYPGGVLTCATCGSVYEAPEGVLIPRGSGGR